MTTEASVDTRTRLLVAAENVLIRAGIQGLTFDAVATEAGLSKGGVLHHFRTKENLVDALARRYVERFDQGMATELERDHGKPGSVTRAYIAVSLESARKAGLNYDLVGARLIAGLSSNPENLRPVRNQNTRWQASIEQDKLDAVMATIVRLAVEGLWYLEVMGSDRLSKEMRESVIRTLTGMTHAPPSPDSRVAAPGDQEGRNLSPGLPGSTPIR